MGIKTELRKIAVKQFLERVPIMKKLFNWLTDPAAIARKRTIATAAGVLAAALRGAEISFKAACDAGDFIAVVCKIDPGTIASGIDFVIQFLNTVLIPGADAVAVGVGAWGLWAAWKKSRQAK